MTNVRNVLLNKLTIGGSLLLTGAIFVGFASERSWMTRTWNWSGPLNWSWAKTFGMVPLLMGVAVLTDIDPFRIENRASASAPLPVVGSL